MSPDISELIKTLRRGKASYTPIAELGIHPLIKEKFLQRPISTIRDDIDFWYQAGYDYIKLQPIANFNPGGLFEQDRETFNDDGSIKRKWATEGKGIITTFEEFERYQFPEKSDFDYSPFEKASEFLPEGMGIIGQYGDIFTMTWELMGFEGFSYALVDNPKLISEINTVLGELVLSMFEYFAQSDLVDVLWYSDDIAYTTGLLMSPETLDKYFFPWLRKIGQIAKSYDKPLIYHSDGVLFSVMDKIIDAGVDALHPIEPQAMDIAEVKRKYGDKLALIGNIDVGELLTLGTEEQVEKAVRLNIEKVGYNGGYCVGSGNSIPEYVRFENYLAMLKAAKKYGS